VSGIAAKIQSSHLEAASPAKTLPSKEELLAFQARWMRPAGISAVLGGFVIAASLPLQPSGSGDGDAERLTKFAGEKTELIVGQGILIGIAVLLFIPALYVLIHSAQGRTQRVRRAMVSLAFIGPILFSVSGVFVAIGLNDVAQKFVDQAPAKEQQARDQATSAPGTQAQPKTTTGTTSSPQTTTTPETTTTTPRTPEQAAGKARDDLASDLLDDSSVLQVGSLMRFIGLLTLVFALIYIPLWSMRTGLLTRFWAMLGLALGVSLLLVPIGIFGLVIWFVIIGLMLAGWWPGSLPPAWDAGEAIPWPSRADAMGSSSGDSGPADTVEGSGREISEQPLQDDVTGEPQLDPGETQGQRRKKRKRRR
jgi:hypothetical protein